MNDIINDYRSSNEFKKLTFSNYKKADVIKEYIKSLKDAKHESSCYWSAELISSGNFIELWESIILYMSKFIHIGNPKLPIYIDSSIESFKSIISQEQITDEIVMRNNSLIRKLFAEIYFQKYMSGNIFPEINFQKYISANIFQKVYS